MKKLTKLSNVFLVQISTAVLTAAPFTPGNLVIFRVGDGSMPLTNTGSPVFLDEYTTNGTLVQSIMLPTTNGPGLYPFIASGTATSEGLITRSPDKRFLAMIGYGTTLGGTNVLADSASALIPRVVAIVDYMASVDTSTALTNFASANNPRSAITTDGTNIWVSGAGTRTTAPGGVAFTTRSSSMATIVSTNPVNNTRQLGIFFDQLYVSSGVSSFRIGTVGIGLPTSGPVTMTNLPGIPTTGINPYSFVILSLLGTQQPDTMYVADDTSGAGIIKYSYVQGQWISNGVIRAPSIRGLVATVSISETRTNVYLYGTTGASTASGGGVLYTAVDSAGYNMAPSSETATIIASAPPYTAFRGIAFAPEPPPPAPPSEAIITSIETTGSDVKIYWSAPSGSKCYVQAATPKNLSVNAPFEDIAGPILITPGSTITNYLDPGAITNFDARYYRIRVESQPIPRE